MNPFCEKSLFPPPQSARDDLNGLIAVSRELSAELLVDAYTHGIFPWEVNDNGVFWFSPPARMVVNPADFRAAKSFKKFLKNHDFVIRADADFSAIIRHCAQKNRGSGTWIVPKIISAYEELFALNIAHCLGVYQNGVLVGGLYGVQIGAMFSGESMFFDVANASKFAVFALCQQAENFGISLIDCQIPSPHFLQWGGKILKRDCFLELIQPLVENFSPQQWIL